MFAMVDGGRSGVVLRLQRAAVSIRPDGAIGLAPVPRIINRRREFHIDDVCRRGRLEIQPRLLEKGRGVASSHAESINTRRRVVENQNA